MKIFRHIVAAMALGTVLTGCFYWPYDDGHHRGGYERERDYHQGRDRGDHHDHGGDRNREGDHDQHQDHRD